MRRNVCDLIPLLKFSTMVLAMATVNFSVPDDVKDAFNETFKGRNKSAVIAALMLEAVERERDNRESRRAIRRILHDRRTAPIRSDDELRLSRIDGRR